MVWPHGKDTLQDFLQHLNQQHPSIKFTMETEEDHKIAFLDVGISRNPDGSLHHNVYRKPTHTDQYLNQRSFHHPSIKSSVNRTLVQRAYNICDKDSLPKELQHIRTTLKRKISTAKPVPNPESKVTDLTLSACLPYLGSTSHKLQRILRQAGIDVFHSAPSKLQGLLHTHKDKPDPNNRAGVYRIPCECGKVYIGETKRKLPTRLKEHGAHGRRGDFDKSAIVKHSHIKDHQIDWQAAQLITPIDAWHPRSIRESIEIVKHDTVPQDIGFFISDIWRPILQTEGSSISKVYNPHQTEGSPIAPVTLELRLPTTMSVVRPRAVLARS